MLTFSDSNRLRLVSKKEILSLLDPTRRIALTCDDPVFLQAIQVYVRLGL